MREVDRLTTRDFQFTSLSLMQAAAEACFQAIATHYAGELRDKKTLILCGRGNNGGDGAALAIELYRAGVYTDVVLFGRVEQTSDDARTNFEIVRRQANLAAGSPAGNQTEGRLTFVEGDNADLGNLTLISQTYDFVVDALFGTGLTRQLEGVFLQVVEHLGNMRAARERLVSAGIGRPLIVSIDLPSGLNADSATAIGKAVQADLTVTFTAPKPANVLPPAAHLNGKLVIANIGSPASLIDGAKPHLFVTEENDVRRLPRH